MNRHAIVLSILNAWVAVLVSASCAGTQQEGLQAAVGTAYIGSVISLTGTNAESGLAATRGLEMAVGEINDDGGFRVGGKYYKLELLKADDQGKREQGMVVVTKMLSDNKHPPVVIGAINSGVAAPIAELGKVRNDFILMSPATVIANFLSKGGLVFKINPPMEWVAPDYIDYVIDKLGVKSVGVLLPDEDIGHSIANDEVRPQFQRRGAKVMDILYYPGDTRDFSRFLTSFRANKPDLLFQGTDDSRSREIIRQALELGVTKNIMNRGGTLVAALPFKDQIDNYTAQVVFDIDYSKTPRVTAWKGRFQKRFGRAPDNAHADGMAFNAYDNVFMVAKAMEKAGTVANAQALAKALREIEYDGVHGQVRFDSLGRSLNTIEAAHMRRGGDVTIFPLLPKPDMVPRP